MPGNKKTLCFDKNDSNFFQGIAILMMIFLHLYAFPERVPSTYISILNHVDPKGLLLKEIATFGHICVSIFVFISGYGMQYSERKGKNNFVKKIEISIRRVIVFWEKYFLQFLFFVSIGIILGRLCVSSATVLKAAVGISCSRINGEWWYVTLYIKLIIAFPIISLIFQRARNTIGYIIAVVVMSMGGYWVLGGYGPLFCVGIFCAATDLVNRLGGWISKLKNEKIIALILIIIILSFRFIIMEKLGYTVFYFDLLFLPLLCSLFLVIKNTTTKIYSVIVWLGKNSMYMWLSHTFYIYYYFQKAIFLFKYAFLIYIVTVVISLITSLFFERIYKTILMKKICNYIWKIVDKVTKRTLESPH